MKLWRPVGVESRRSWANSGGKDKLFSRQASEHGDVLHGRFPQLCQMPHIFNLFNCLFKLNLVKIYIKLCNNKFQLNLTWTYAFVVMISFFPSDRYVTAIKSNVP